MKRTLVVACALGLSAPMEFADCAYHQASSIGCQNSAGASTTSPA
ncbi:hypothetical protein [Mycoplana dimorpha]|nr:hypothetical protein [Mycoplana dimorpha]